MATKKVASRGPAPKRQAGSAKHRTTSERPDTAQVHGRVEVPSAPRSWQPLAKRWYEALAQSGHVRWFEPSDWAAAQLAGELMSRMLRGKQINGQLLAQLLRLLSALGTTESDRRRMRIEIERVTEPRLATVSSLEDQRSRVEAAHRDTS